MVGFTKNHLPVPSCTSEPTLPSISTSPPSDSTTVPLTARGTTSAPPFIVPSPTASASKTDDNHDSGRPPPALALLNNLGRGGYAGVRLGEDQNPGPATHDRDRTAAEQRTASHRRINEEGDSVPGSQTPSRGEFNTCKYQTPQVRKPLLQPHRHRRCPTHGDLLRRRRNSSLENTSSVRSVAPHTAAVRAVSGRGLMLHMVQKHGGQRLLPESVAQLRNLDRAACIACDTIGSQRCLRCTFCGSGAPLRDLRTTVQPMRLLQQQYTTP